MTPKTYKYKPLPAKTYRHLIIHKLIKKGSLQPLKVLAVHITSDNLPHMGEI